MPTILITGANRGIGFELSRQYLEQRWRVHACCRDPQKAGGLRDLAGADEGRLAVHRLDVTDRAPIRALADALGDEPIDILINNAGIYGDKEGAFGRVDDDAWIETFRANTIAPLHVSESLLENVAASERKIIATMSSKMGSISDNTSGGHYIYRSSKAAVNIVAKSMAVDLKDRGITVVLLHPGWVRTDMGGPAAPLTVEQSVSGLRKVLSSLSFEDSGRFIGHDGVEVPW